MDDPLQCIKGAHKAILERARSQSDSMLTKAGDIIAEYLISHGQNPDGLCFAAVGSVGRREALEASDLDIVPIAADGDRLTQYMPADAGVREALRNALEVKVSKGEDLTKSTSLCELVEADSIGGSLDSSGKLTKRVLLLTESAQAGGTLPIRDVRQALLDAYGKEERTSGRHVLALCNDIARYYKLLCIEYKAKIDEQDKDWCTRNIKLRHSRKVWYFSNIMVSAQPG